MDLWLATVEAFRLKNGSFHIAIARRPNPLEKKMKQMKKGEADNETCRPRKNV
jgi:hypothetical protein